MDDSTITNLIDVIAEGGAEIARYGEYLLLEKKWKTASNMSSLTHLASLISAKRRRPTSSIGYVIVSHNDINGVNRLANFGRSFFTLDDYSDFDNIAQSTNSTFSETRALVPWTFDEPYVIPKGTVFTSVTGIPFLSLQQVSSRVLKEPYNIIKNTPAKYETFIQAGGWNGIKYLKVPVIQGVEETVSFGYARGERFETFLLNTITAENASNSLSYKFFKVVATYRNGQEEEWVEIPNIRLAGPYDKVYETKLLDDDSGIAIKFGDGLTGWMIPQGTLLKCTYLDSMGHAGNIDLKYQVTKMAFPNGEVIKDPRTNAISNFLSCTNITAIKGGRDIDTEEDFRLNAPTDYMKSYTTATTADYEYQIMQNSPLSLLNIKCFPSEKFDVKTFNFEQEEIGNRIASIQKTLGITAILSSGDKIEGDPQLSFIEPITQALGTKKGPNDFFSYVEPNFIKMATGIKIISTDMSVPKEQAYDEISMAILDKYSIFDTNFQVPFYSSDLIHIAKQFKYTDSAALTLEAMATTSFDNKAITIVSLDNKPFFNDDNTIRAETTVVGIPFKFDTIYGEKQIEAGFKNYKNNGQYLIKVDVKFIAGSEFAMRNRTFFLFDNRDEVDGEVQDLQTSKGLVISNQQVAPESVYKITNSVISSNLIYYNEYKDGYDNRQVRVGQYQYISDITDDEFMQHVKNYGQEPFEYRPYVVDTTTGNNQLFQTSLVLESERVSLAGDDQPVTGTVCYKRNTKYFKNIDIVFNENYNQPNSPQFASGYVMLPINYLNFTAQLNGIEESFLYEAIENLLKNNIEIKVYAQPNLKNLETTHPNDIIFIDEEDIKVSKAS